MGTVTHAKQPQSPRVTAYERQLRYLTASFYEALRAADLGTLEAVTLQMVTVSERLGAARHGLQLERLIMGIGYEDDPLPPDDAILDVVVEHADAVHPEWEASPATVDAPA